MGRVPREDARVEYHAAQEERVTPVQPSGVQLRAVLEALAPGTDADKLTRLADSLALHGQLYRAARPAAARRGTAPALRSLERLHQALWKAAEAIEHLGADELLELERQPEGSFSVPALRSLAHLNERVVTAHADLSAGPEHPTLAQRRPKTEARMIALRCARLFQALTGKPATVITKDGTARGPFLGFVADVFRILEVDGSPETWARNAVKERRARAEGEKASRPAA